jgi:hypothetical protein
MVLYKKGASMHFPRIVVSDDKSLVWQAYRVLEELKEFEQSQANEPLINQALEVIDVLHAAETLVRKFFLLHPELDFETIKQEVIAKNRAREYYGA